jgi:hypothetical protein
MHAARCQLWIWATCAMFSNAISRIFNQKNAGRVIYPYPPIPALRDALI